MQHKAQSIYDRMMKLDYFSQWLGIQLINIEPGYCVLRMTVRQDMLNGFGILHGGISYSIADSALAFASNAHGRQAVSIESSISHLRPVRAGDIITATAREQHLTYRLGLYYIDITKPNSERIAAFKGTVYRKEKLWELE